MHQTIVIGLAIILVLGIAAQWLAWHFKVPSILLLLLFGFIAGPVTGFIHPDELFGELLFPFVSISVAIILFEGGLSLKLDEVREVQGVVQLLITLGALVTWVLISLAAVFILRMEMLLAILLGAILVVTGPTVVIPLLRQIRPTNRVSSILKWEGILIDPIGATLAVLVFEGILDSEMRTTAFTILRGIAFTLLTGTMIGAITGKILVEFLRRSWIDPFLETAVALVAVVAAFALSNQIYPESGLMAATAMGIFLANQKQADVKHIATFKEELGVLLLSVLFIGLAARVEASALRVAWPELLFLIMLILVVRPLAAGISTIGSRLLTKERLFISALAPRGIVAVSVASLFALELESAGFAGAERLVNMTFLVVMGTVVVHSLTAKPLARWLGLVQEHPQGTLFVGAHDWARRMARALQQNGLEVWLVDTNATYVEAAREAGLPVIQDSILAEGVLEALPLERIGRLLGLTANGELNTLASLRFDDWLGKDNVYQLMPARGDEPDLMDEKLLAHILFGPEVSYKLLNKLHYSGGKILSQVVESTTDVFYEPAELLLFVVTEDGRLLVPTAANPITPLPGQTAIYFLPEQDKINVQVDEEKPAMAIQ